MAIMMLCFIIEKGSLVRRPAGIGVPEEEVHKAGEEETGVLEVGRPVGGGLWGTRINKEGRGGERTGLGMTPQVQRMWGGEGVLADA